MLEMRELTIVGIVVRVLVAIVLGGVVGLDRGIKNRPAGLRTYMLVSLGACVVMLINQYTYQVFDSGDPVRLGAQVISGIGFLGAGTIIVTSHNQIKGLTTAAGLWASACIGLAVGIGLYEVAAAGGLGVFFILTVLHEWDDSIRSRTRVIDIYVELDQSISLGAFIRNAREMELEISNIQREHEAGYNDDVLSLIVTVRGKKKMNQQELVKALKKVEGIKYLEVL